MIDPGTIIFAINAAIKLARAGDKALAQHARDKAVELPWVDSLRKGQRETIEQFIGGVADNAAHVAKDPETAAAWKRFVAGDPKKPDDIDALFAVAVQLRFADEARRGHQPLSTLSAAEIRAVTEVKQWRKGEGPQEPWVGFALAVADIAIEYVAADPSITGLKGGPAKFIGGVAANLGELVAKNDPWDKRAFAERLVEIVVHAGLKALVNRPETLISDEDYRVLVKNTLAPVIAAWEAGKADERHDYRILVDALLGPAFNAAITTLAERPTAFFGTGLAPNKLAGHVVKALLDEAKTRKTAGDFFKDETYIALVRAAMRALAGRPELVIGTDENSGAIFARELFKQFLGAASALVEPGTLFTREFGAALAVALVESVEASGSRIVRKGNPWQILAESVLTQVAAGIKGVLKGADGATLAKLVSEEFLIELARRFFLQAAKTPHMLVPNRPELQNVVAAVMRVIAADTDLILTREDWLAVAAAAAEEAAANPGRLFRLDPGVAESLGSAVLGDVFRFAAARFSAAAAGPDAILFGSTLREILIVTLRSGAANFERLRGDPKLLSKLIDEILKVVKAEPGRFGSKELLATYKALIGKTLSEGTTVALTAAAVEGLLTRAKG